MKLQEESSGLFVPAVCDDWAKKSIDQTILSFLPIQAFLIIQAFKVLFVVTLVYAIFAIEHR